MLIQHDTGPYYVGGSLNRGADGTISRFGWKAQVKSLELFAGAAYNIEQGVSNELFPQERPSPEENRDQGPGLAQQCRLNPTPEDHTNFDAPAVDTPSDTVMFAMFMRLLEPPTENPGNPATNPNYSRVLNRQIIFMDIGCNSVRHVHLLSAFPEQAEPIMRALRDWRFRPYIVDGKGVEVETGLVFGLPRLVVR